MMRGGMGLGVVARNVRRVDSSAVLPSSSSFVRLTADCLHNTNGQSISTRSAKAMIAYSTVAQPSQDPSSGRLFSTSAPPEASISRFHSPSTPAPSSSLVESQRSTTAELMNEFINVTELDEAKQPPSPSNYNVQSGSVASIDSSIAPGGPFSGVKGEPFFADQAYLDWPFPSQEHGNASLRMAGFMEGYDAEHHHSTSGYATSHHNAFVLDHKRIPQRSNDCASEPRGSAMQGSLSTLHVANSLSSRTAYSNPNVRAPDVGRRLFDLSSRFPSTPAQPDSRRQYSYSYSPSSSPITSPITAFPHRPNWFDGRSVSSLSRGVRPTINTYNLPSHYGLPSAAHYMSSSATTGQDGDPSPSSAGVGDETIDNTTAPEKKRKRSSEKDEAKPKGSSKGQKDQAKDKNAVPAKSPLHPPKPAPSSWQIFFTDHLRKFRDTYPDEKLNVAHIAKEAGALYKDLSSEDKEVYKKRAKKEKDLHDKAYAAWQKTLTPDDIRNENAFRTAQRRAGKSKKLNIKDPNAPKKPLSPYFMYLASIRTDSDLSKEIFGSETETTKQSQLAAARWNTLSEEEKKPFLERAEREKSEYMTKYKEYEDQFTASISNKAPAADIKLGSEPGLGMGAVEDEKN